MIYTFQGGSEIVKIRGEPIKDLEIASSKTNNRFVRISAMLNKQQMEVLGSALSSVYDEYLVKEFNKMGYTLIKKEVGHGNAPAGWK